MGMLSDGLELLRLFGKGVNATVNADTHDKLAKFIERANDLQAEIETLKDSNKKLEEQLRFKGSLYRIEGVLFADGDPEPLCGKCAEVDAKLVHLVLNSFPYTCPNCRIGYFTAKPRPEMQGEELRFIL